MHSTILYPIRNPDITTRLLPDGKVVLYNEKTQYAHVLSPLGSVIWEFCDGEHTAAEILTDVARLLDESDLDHSTLESTSDTFFAELFSIGLLMGSPPA